MIRDQNDKDSSTEHKLIHHLRLVLPDTANSHSILSEQRTFAGPGVSDDGKWLVTSKPN